MKECCRRRVEGVEERRRNRVMEERKERKGVMGMRRRRIGERKEKWGARELSAGRDEMVKMEVVGTVVVQVEEEEREEQHWKTCTASSTDGRSCC
jgi:hypothetical protein